VLGRTFLAEDEQPGHERVILISYELWQRRFGSDQNLIGKNLILDNKNYTVIGVMPPQLEFPGWLDLTAQKNSAKVEIWTPLTFTPDELQTRGARFVNALGRLKDGVSLGQAQTEMEAIAGQLEQTYQDNEGYTVTITPLQEQAVGSIKISLLILFGAICLVLLIACANVASLLLARAMTRQREIAIRLALGCSRSRLARQLLTESIILSILSGMVGLLIAYWGSRLFVSNIPGGLPRSGEVGIDGQVFAFMLAISILAGVLFGLLPAIQASKPDFNETLKQGGRGAAESLGRNRTRSILVISEITLSLVLLIGASLLIKSFLRLVSTDPGFNPDKIIAMRVSLPRSRYSKGLLSLSSLWIELRNCQGCNLLLQPLTCL
jgi:putative ABC transport system permease protein